MSLPLKGRAKFNRRYATVPGHRKPWNHSSFRW